MLFRGKFTARGPRALDLANFFIADVQTGFGPFVAVYLTMHKWTQVQIGFVLTLGTIVALISQLPAGALVDALRNKRAAASGALIGVMIAALLLAIQPTELPVTIAQTLHAFSSCVLTPAIAAISLHLVGHDALGERLGRNARFASLGNGFTAAVMGATGAYLSSRAVFILTAALCVPALLTLLAIGRGPHARQQTTIHPFDWPGLRRLFSDRRLLAFAVCVLLFHVSNAAMLPLVGATVTMRAGDFANLIIAACIMAPQGVVALCSPAVGRAAAALGRRPVLLLGWARIAAAGNAVGGASGCVSADYRSGGQRHQRRGVRRDAAADRGRHHARDVAFQSLPGRAGACRQSGCGDQHDIGRLDRGCPRCAVGICHTRTDRGIGNVRVMVGDAGNPAE